MVIVWMGGGSEVCMPYCNLAVFTQLKNGYIPSQPIYYTGMLYSHHSSLQLHDNWLLFRKTMGGGFRKL